MWWPAELVIASGTPPSISLDTYSHAIPALQEAAALIAGLVLAEG
jgi:hypothetical protein